MKIHIGTEKLNKKTNNMAYKASKLNVYPNPCLVTSRKLQILNIVLDYLSTDTLSLQRIIKARITTPYQTHKRVTTYVGIQYGCTMNTPTATLSRQ